MLLALFSNLISLAVEAVSKVFLLLVLPTLESAQYPQAFGPQPVLMLANLALLFFGGTCLVNGYLIFKAGYFPKALGVLMQAVGACCLVACWAALFAPALASSILSAALLPCLVGELSWYLWMLVKGVDGMKWWVSVRMNQKV